MLAAAPGMKAILLIQIDYKYIINFIFKPAGLNL